MAAGERSSTKREKGVLLQIISLRVDKWEEPCIGLTQENLIKNSVQDLSTLYTKVSGLC